MENKTEVKIFDTPAKLAKSAAKAIGKLTRKYGNLPFHVAISGGTTPIPLFEVLVEKFSEKGDWSLIHFWWSDERCVDPGSSESNYRMAMEKLLSRVPVPEENIHRIRGEADPLEEAVRYGREIMESVPLWDQWPVFNLILLGMGDDGHVASIFPGQLHLFESEKPCEVSEHPSTGQHRITLTGKVINHARHVMITVTGESKSKQIAAVMNNRKPAEKLPVYFVNPLRGDLTWYLDVAAASRI